MDRINTLRDKLDILLRQYRAMNGELSAYRRVLNTKDEEIAMLRTQVSAYEEQLLALQIGEAIPDEESRANSRKQLDAVIGEIDKILGTLND